MRRGRIFFYLAFILILGLVAVVVVWQRFIVPSQQQVVVDATPTPIPVEVVIVAQNLPKGYILDSEVLSTIPWQQEALAPGMYTGGAINELYGRQVKYDLSQGTLLMDTLLLREGEQIPLVGSSWALNIPSGMVAVSIPITRLSSVSFAPRPGDHVNVISTYLFVDIDTDFQSILPNHTGVVVAPGPPNPETGEPTIVQLTTGISSLYTVGDPDPETGKIGAPSSLSPGIFGRVEIDPVLGQAVYLVPSERQRPRMVSQMLLQDVVVLQIGNFPLPGEEEKIEEEEQQEQPAQEPGQEEAPPPVIVPEVVTLIVRPQDAVTLNYLLQEGFQRAVSLSLALRSPNDNSRENIIPVTLQYLLEQYQIPVPARLPYSLEPRLDFLLP